MGPQSLSSGRFLLAIAVAVTLCPLGGCSSDARTNSELKLSIVTTKGKAEHALLQILEAPSSGLVLAAVDIEANGSDANGRIVYEPGTERYSLDDEDLAPHTNWKESVLRVYRHHQFVKEIPLISQTPHAEAVSMVKKMVAASDPEAKANTDTDTKAGAGAGAKAGADTSKI